MANARALRLQIGATQSVAIALHEMIEVIEGVEPIQVPRAPRHCQTLVRWRDRLVPIFDLVSWCEFERGDATAGVARFHAILSYDSGDPDRPGYGCLALDAFPVAIAVDDQMACALPAELWAPVSLSCFREGEAVLPVLHLAALFDPTVRGADLAVEATHHHHTSALAIPA